MKLEKWVYYAIGIFVIGVILIISMIALGYICVTAMNISPSEKTTGFLGIVCGLFV